MNNMYAAISNYLEFCQYQKRLDGKTLKAYRIDLSQFQTALDCSSVSEITSELLENYIVSLHQTYKPKTAKRKIASLKAFFHYLEYRNMIEINPFNKIVIKFREPVLLPKTIPLHTVEAFLSTMYRQRNLAKNTYQKRNVLRDIAVVELLFATGIRISELCSLKPEDINFPERNILIYGKGAKERQMQIGSQDVLNILWEYSRDYHSEMQNCHHFFANQSGTPLSDQAIRRMINKYAALSEINLHITPHMFRHTFATSLLEADVDIRYIQKMLGHSSINVTELYTHVTIAKQRDILAAKHPRKDFKIQE